MVLVTRPNVDELRSISGSLRLVWLSTLVNVPSTRSLNRSVSEKVLLTPEERLTSPGPTTEPTSLLPNRPMGNGTGPFATKVPFACGVKPAPVVQAVPGVQAQ